MGVYPNQYSREEFLKKFLKKNHISKAIINKFIGLPEKIIVDGHDYDIYINVTFINVGDTCYNFELNYYSEELVEYLFNSKVLTDIEISINNLMCELINKGFFEEEKKM